MAVLNPTQLYDLLLKQNSMQAKDTVAPVKDCFVVPVMWPDAADRPVSTGDSEYFKAAQQSCVGAAAQSNKVAYGYTTSSEIPIVHGLSLAPTKAMSLVENGFTVEDENGAIHAVNLSLAAAENCARHLLDYWHALFNVAKTFRVREKNSGTVVFTAHPDALWSDPAPKSNAELLADYARQANPLEHSIESCSCSGCKANRARAGVYPCPGGWTSVPPPKGISWEANEARWDRIKYEFSIARMKRNLPERLADPAKPMHAEEVSLRNEWPLDRAMQQSTHHDMPLGERVLSARWGRET